MTILRRSSQSEVTILRTGLLENTEAQGKVKQAQADMLSMLDIDTKLINRNHLSSKIFTSRSNSGVPLGAVELRDGVMYTIDTTRYADIFKQYKENSSNENFLHQLDTQLAERIILDNGYILEFKDGEGYAEHKNSESESERAFEGLNDCDWYNGQLTLAHKKINNNNYFVIKWTDAQLSEIKQKINELSNQEDENERIKSLEDSINIKDKIIKELMDEIKKLKEGKQSNTDTAKKEDDTAKKEDDTEKLCPQDLVLDSSLSDVSDAALLEKISLEVEEELRKEYNGLSGLSFKRIGLFFSRGARRKEMIAKRMNELSGKVFTGDDTIDQQLSNAADRHVFELHNKLSDVEQTNTVMIQHPHVNELCNQYLQGAISVDQFQTEFNAIIAGDKSIQNILRGLNSAHVGSNILLTLDRQKAKFELQHYVTDQFIQYFASNNEHYIDLINDAIKKYVHLHQEQPLFMDQYADFINNEPGSKEKLKKILKHQLAVMKAQVQNVKMNINMLQNGKSAYQIDNSDREKSGIYKLGHYLDKLPTWLQVGGLIGIGVCTGIMTGGLGTLASAAITTGTSATSVGLFNYFKKYTHYTKEQNTHEKNVVTEKSTTQQEIIERQKQAINGKWYERKTYKAKRQLALYDQTTQENVVVAQNISDTLTDISSTPGALTESESNYLHKLLIEGWARLQMYNETGHNFLASNNANQTEHDFLRLEKSLVLAGSKIGLSSIEDIKFLRARDDFGGLVTYQTITEMLKESYNKSIIQFKRERRNLAMKYGISSALLSGGLSMGMQYLFGTGVFAKSVSPVPGSSFGGFAGESFNLGSHELLDPGYKNDIVTVATDVFSDSRLSAGSIVDVSYGAGTDGSTILPGKLTYSDYTTKLDHVINYVNSLSIDTALKHSFLTELNTKTWESSRTGSGFTNDYLHGMRCAEFLEHTATALQKSGSKDITLNFIYDKARDVIGTTKNSAMERVVHGDFCVTMSGSDGSTPNTWGKYLFAPLLANTFKKKTPKKLPDTVQQKNKEDNGPELKDKEEKYDIQKAPPVITDKPKYWKDKREKQGENPFKDDGFEPITPKPFDEKLKIGVTPRAIFIDGHDIAPKELGKQYPVDFRFKTDDEIADIILDSGVPLYEDEKYEELTKNTQAIKQALQVGDRITAKKLLTEIIILERTWLSKQTETLNDVISIALNTINSTFDFLGGDRSMAPDASKIHLVGAYDFWGQHGGYNPNLLGFCSYMNGELFINMDALWFASDKSEERSAILLHTIIHELVHGTSTANYRHQYSDLNALDRQNDKNHYPNARRLGAQFTRFKKNTNDGSIKINERGRALNEAITETMTLEMLKGLEIKSTLNCYPKEREVLKLLSDTHNIKMEDFYKLLVNRKGSIQNINKQLSGKLNSESKKYERPMFYTLLMSIMDFEYNAAYRKVPSGNPTYKLTKAFIKGEDVIINLDMVASFHPGLLNIENDTIKDEILESYPNLKYNLGDQRMAA